MKSFKEFISRVGKARGFGIQSPWAYRFVTEVVGERYPYYYYEEIERQYPNVKERKFQKLVFRISNFTYPAETVVMNIEDAHGHALDDAVRRCGTGGAIVLRGINSSDKARQQWQQVLSRQDIGVTFDMYHFAVCFLDTAMYKQHYRLNF